MTIRRLLLVIHAAIVVGFVVLHLAGARAYVGFLSGTLSGGAAERFVGLAYALAWFAVVVWVPVVAIAVILDVACGTLVKHRRWRRSAPP
jgi:CHASE2 domain-containing sensor protein